MAKWSGPTWHTPQRRKIAGFYRYQLTAKEISWFNRWHELVPLEKWQQKIEQWQQKFGSFSLQVGKPTLR
jgi:hypothetical protein